MKIQFTFEKNETETINPESKNKINEARKETKNE